MKIQSISTNQYQHDSSLKYLGKSINNIPTSIKDAIAKAINTANLKGKDKIIIPRAFLKGAEFSARISFNTSIADLNTRQWKDYVEKTLMNIDPKDIKTKSFLNYFLLYLK